MEHRFKNGIVILIPDELQNRLDEWNNVKVIMSIILGTPAKEPINLHAIFNTVWPPLKRRPKLKSRKSYHKTSKKK